MHVARAGFVRALLSGLIGAVLSAIARASVVPSQDSTTSIDPRISALVVSAISSASLRPYAQPSAKVEQVLAIGDTFTACIGSNALNQELKPLSNCYNFQNLESLAQTVG